jgi:transposase InsO family protein
MHAELTAEGLRIGRHRIARLMRQNGLRALPKRRDKRTTDRHHGAPVAPNLLDQDFATSGPNQKWGADLSYIWTSEGWLYLAIVLDLFSRRIVGWAVSDRLKKDLALSALRKAIIIRRPPRGVIHHADRGSQGGFKWSSQHPSKGSCDARSKAAVGSVGASAPILTRSSAGCRTGGATAVLDGDRGRHGK